MIKVLLCFSLLISISSLAGVRCDSALSSSQKSHLDLSDFTLPSLKVPTAKISRTITKEGLRYHIVQRTAARWSSIYSPDDKNHQGDPRNFIILFGEKLASEFGYLMISNLEIQVPTTETLNELIKRKNKKLVHPISIQFYQAPQDPVGDLEYNILAEKNHWPEAMGGHYFLHDSAFHRNLFVPEVVQDFVAQRSFYIREFLKMVYVRTQNFPPELKSQLQNIENKLFEYQAEDFDVMSGNMMIVTTERYGDSNQFKNTEQYETAVLNRINSGLQKVLQNVWLKNANEKLNHYFFSSKTKLDVSRYTEWSQTLFDIQDQYLKSVPPEYLENLKMTHQELAVLIDARIKELRNSILSSTPTQSSPVAYWSHHKRHD